MRALLKGKKDRKGSNMRSHKTRLEKLVGV